MVFAQFISAVACITISFFLYGMFQCEVIVYLIHPFVRGGHLGCLHFLALRNDAAMNVVLHGLMFSVLLCLSASGITGSYAELCV